MSSFSGELCILGDFNLHLIFITRTGCDLIKTVYSSDGLSVHMTVIGNVGVILVSHPIKKSFSHRRHNCI